MTDAFSSGSDAESHTSRLHGTHRINHVLYGHLGRLSYHPSEDDERGIGDLTSERTTVRAPHFRQVSPFQEWFAPSKTLKLSDPTSKASQSIRSQDRWLLKSHPEAFLGYDELRDTLAEEIPRSRTSHETFPASSLLAVGEIHDKSSSWKSRACPAVALAAGEAGHILRVATLQNERWAWATERSQEINLASTSASDQGFWCADGVAITKIQFATVRKRYDQVRWLIVQKATSTTIFQPELRKQPVGDAALPCYLDPHKTSHISVNPILAFTLKNTGGNAHCDFAFNPGSGNDLPQLVIVDQSGVWTIWDITRERLTRRMALTHTFRRSGRLVESPSANNPVPRLHQIRKPHRVFWVTREVLHSSTWNDPESPSEDSASRDDGHVQLLLGFEAPAPRCNTLFFCDNKSVQLFDARLGSFIARVEIAKHGTSDCILDTQVSSHSRAQVFVLTKTTLNWIDVFPSNSDESGSPFIQLSCPHHRDGDADGLKMVVASDQPNGGSDVSLVIVFSPRTLYLDLYWFVQLRSRPTFHHQSVRLSDLADVPSSNLIGLESLTVIPAPLSRRRRKADNEALEANSHPPDVRYLQILGLGTDLGLKCSLATTSVSTAHQETAPDVRIDPLRPDRKRRRFLQETGESFVIPDFVEQGLPPRETPVRSTTSGMLFPPPSTQHSRRSRHLQLWRFVSHLFADVARTLPSKDANLDHGGAAVLLEMRRVVDETFARDEGEGYESLRPVLELVQNPQEHYDIGIVEPHWTSALSKTWQSRNNRVRVLQLGRYQAKLNVADLFETLSILWSARLPGDQLRPALWRRIEFAIERIAIEAYLSGRGIRIIPERLLEAGSYTAVEEEAPEENDTQASTSRVPSALPTPSTSPSSAQPSTSGQEESEEVQREDSAIMRLRTYAASIKAPPILKTGESRLLSHWPRDAGRDPDEYVYLPEESRRRDAERVKTWRRQQEDRRRRRAASQSLLKHEESGDSSSQPVAWHAYSSQPHPASSQSQGPITMSQPISGQHGARSGLGKKKGKAKKTRRITGGFR